MVDPWLEWSAYAQRRLNYSAGDIQVVRYPLKMPDGSVLQRTSDLKAINNRAEAHIGDKARRMGGAQIAGWDLRMRCNQPVAQLPDRPPTAP